MYDLFIHLDFEKQYTKLDHSLQIEIDRSMEQIRNNPHVGKPLGLRFIREKKVRFLRIYFIIDEQQKRVLIAEISGKKDQQRVIDKIKKNFEQYKQKMA